MGRTGGGGPGRGPPPLLLLLGATLVLAAGAAPGRYRLRPGPQWLSRLTLGQGPAGLGYRRSSRSVARGRGSALPATGAGEGAREEVGYLGDAEKWGAAPTGVCGQGCRLGEGPEWAGPKGETSGRDLEVMGP